MLDPLGLCQLHILGAQNRGEFLQQSFYVSRDRTGIFCKEGGGSNRDWFSRELKLDDFTSGFQTTCADMAGGWEEVIAAGIFLTGAGTDVEVGREDESDEAAESK
jgi:hypothetical protein